MLVFLGLKNTQQKLHKGKQFDKFQLREEDFKRKEQGMNYICCGMEKTIGVLKGAYKEEWIVL